MIVEKLEAEPRTLWPQVQISHHHQSDLLSGKPRNVSERASCKGHVRKLSTNLRSFWKNFARKTVVGLVLPVLRSLLLTKSSGTFCRTCTHIYSVLVAPAINISWTWVKLRPHRCYAVHTGACYKVAPCGFVACSFRQSRMRLLTKPHAACGFVASACVDSRAALSQAPVWSRLKTTWVGVPWTGSEKFSGHPSLFFIIKPQIL